MDDLITWLRAQLDAIEGNICPRPRKCGRAFHTADENFMLDDIKAKRRIIDRYEDAVSRQTDPDHSSIAADVQVTEYEEWVLRLLALPYADRPGYRSEWAP